MEKKRRRRVRGKKNTKTIQRMLTLRVVAVRHPQTREFHVYLTNVPREWMTPEQIRISDTARWLVELLFDHLKNECGMKK
ncbi:MAG: transposase [Deltaproteobacteria bacterium]|nr:transposase [Deltaproteobacteria bacterium]